MASDNGVAIHEEIREDSHFDSRRPLHCSDGLIALMNTEPDMEVVAEAADGNQALELFAKHHPDLVLLDIKMPGKSGIQTAMAIRNKFPAARILVLSALDGDEDIYRALNAGAQGYVFKNTRATNWFRHCGLWRRDKIGFPRKLPAGLPRGRLLEELTPREVQILNELAKGLANKEIADDLEHHRIHRERSLKKHSWQTSRGRPDGSRDDCNSTRNHPFVKRLADRFE